MKKGYTLIEILVAVSIFTVIISAPTGFLVGSLRAQLKVLASQKLLDQTSYLMEYMSRALRMAQKDKSGTCVTPGEGNNYKNYEKIGSTGIRFKNYKGECQEFFLDENPRKLKQSINGAASVPLTSDDLEIVLFKIGSDASWDQGDQDQPKVTLFLDIKGGRGRDEKLRPEIKIQTTISQRNLDVPY